MRLFKAVLVISLASLLIFASVGFARKNHQGHEYHSSYDGRLYSFDDVVIRLSDETVLITNEYEDGKIKITDEYELYVNRKLIETDREQRKLLEEYYTLAMDIDDYAKELGKEGAKIGAEGLFVGEMAAASALRQIFNNYDNDDDDDDDLEWRVERAAERLESKAEALEEKAEKIEDMADDLEDLFYDMEESIPAIKKLDW